MGLQRPAVVDNLEMRAGHNLLLRPLASHPFEGLFAGDAIALHDALKAQLLWGGDYDDAVNQTVKSRLKQDAMASMAWALASDSSR